MSNTAKPPTRPTRYWAVEIITTTGKEWILAQAQHQGSAMGRGDKVGNFVRHSQCHELSEEQYNQAKALLAAQPRYRAKMVENRRDAQ